MDADRVRVAHADAWEEHGRFRTPYGGGAVRLPGFRLMASGLPHPQWNNGDVTDPAAVDVDLVRTWYAGVRTPSGEPVGWGVRVPLGMPWPHGRHLFAKRLMGLVPERFAPAGTPDGVVLRQAGPADLDAVMRVDTVAFEEDDAVERPWVEPILSMPAAVVCVAELHGTVVGSGHCVLTDGDAGPAVYVAGIGVLPDDRGRGIGAALTSWLVGRGLTGGATLAHLQADSDAAAGIYRRLGFVEVPGVDVYVDLA